MAELLVLAKPDGSDRTLVAADQADVAREHGYTAVEFATDAGSRGIARHAWDVHRGGGSGSLDAVEATNAWGLESLTDTQREVVTSVVRALVDHDREVLEVIGAYTDGDPYEWTRDYGRLGQVNLMVPPGDPSHWGGGVETDADRPGWAYVIVDMWTQQEGPSDLSLEVEVQVTATGDRGAAFRMLHAM